MSEQVQKKTKRRHVQGRSRNGCATCRKRHRKCDEHRPQCWQCIVDGIECEGYPLNFIWKNYTSNGCRVLDTPLPAQENSQADLNSRRTPESSQRRASPGSSRSDEAQPGNIQQVHLDMIDFSFLSDASPYRCNEFDWHDEDQDHPATQLPQAPEVPQHTHPFRMHSNDQIDYLEAPSWRERFSRTEQMERPESQAIPSLPEPLNFATAVLSHPTDRSAFEYFIVKLSGVAVAFDDSTHNPYRCQVLPMCFQYRSLMHAVLAISALHRWKAEVGDKSRALFHRTKSTQMCATELASAAHATVRTLTEFISQVVYDDGMSVKGLSQLRPYIESSGGVDSADYGSGMISAGYHGACILAAAFSGQYSQRLLDKSPLTWAGCSLESAELFENIPSSAMMEREASSSRAFSFESCWGCHEDIFNFIGSTTKFAMIMRDYNSDIRDALLCEPLFLAHAQKLERLMLEWEAESSLPDARRREMSLNSSMIFRDATLLYFYRIIWDARNSDPRVQNTLGSLLETLG
ncbi:hypothetical protein BDW59DRAFT_166814 [Aspergillus cavernicola]|uniref:Zn(2)-C6 fungal-type domain-containing protein n=1 Tax=Aspergillus cavernicola TaxID=176166 RepID=A0ABR4HIV0_9EURO